MRKHLLTIVLLIAGFAACSSDNQNPLALESVAQSPSPPAIADATSGGREGFYFLQPIVANPKVSGPFDATLVPRARICALDSSRTACSSTILATILTGSGPGSLTVDQNNGIVTGQWSSPSTLELSTASGTETRYRLEVLLDVGAQTVTLGHADLWVIPQQKETKVSPAGFVDLVQGKTLVIRFGVLPTTVGYVTVTPNPVELTIGGTQQMTATAFDVHNVVVASAAFAWSSADPEIAAISSTGYATGLANGSTTVSATTRGVTGSAVINVVGDPPVAATAVADEPAAASAPGDAYHTPFNTTLSSGSTTPGLLENDVRGSPLADVVSFGGGDLGGTVTSNAAGATVTFGTGGSLQVNSDGSFVFTPSTGFTGLFGFSYRIQNSSGTSDAPVAIAVGVRPSASDDTYPVTIIGNVSINTATSSHVSLLANDAGDGLTTAVGASPNGDASINGDGTFTFNPAPGFTGTASFSYTVQNGFGSSAAATVSIPVTTPIWFVHASSPAGGDGRIGSPFNCLVDAGGACYDDSANEAGDFVYIASGTYANSGALALKASQRLIGQGATSSLATLTGLVNAADSPALPSTGGTAPLMTSAAAGIEVASSNSLYGFNVGNTVGSAAILLTNVANVSLSNMTISNNAGNGISGTTVSGFSMNQVVLQNNGDDVSEANVQMNGLTGTVSMTSSTLSNASGDNVRIHNTTGALSISLTGSTLSSDATKPDALNGLAINADGTSAITASIGNNQFQGHRRAHLTITASASASMQVSVTGNTLTCGNATATDCNAIFLSSSNASYVYTIQSNVMTGMKSSIALNKSAGTGSMVGSFSGNAIGATGVAGSGGDGLTVVSAADGVSHIASITANAISNYSLSGIELTAGAAGMLDATVSNNFLQEPGATAQHGVRASSGITPTSTAIMCLAMSNNVMNGSGPVSDFRLIQGGLATMRLPFYAGAKDNNDAVVAFVRSLQQLNTETNPTGLASNTVASGGGGFLGGAECSTP